MDGDDGYYHYDDFFAIDDEGWLNIYIKNRWTEPAISYDTLGRAAIGTPYPIYGSVPTDD